MKIDINCDLGESFGAWRLGDDEEVLRYVTSANVACGFHAGDPLAMERTVRAARERGVAVGAHPGFPDLVGFGRRHLETAPGEVRCDLLYQIGALEAFCRVQGVALQHVKPHGALYNLAARDERVAAEVADAVLAFDPRLILVVLAGSAAARVAAEKGCRVAAEAFPDRAYRADGALAPRGQPGAVIHDPDAVERRVVDLVTRGRLTAIDGSLVALRADTLCVHGDTPGAPELARRLRQALEAAGAEVVPLDRVLEPSP
ncbi:MAG: 5-oxoprolinase subunit PxpA [Thermodesulfobacteriota bacterium]